MFFRQFMSSLQIDSASLRPQPQRIPQELLEKCAAISVRPDAIKDLVSSMQCNFKYTYVN